METVTVTDITGNEVPMLRTEAKDGKVICLHCGEYGIVARKGVQKCAGCDSKVMVHFSAYSANVFFVAHVGKLTTQVDLKKASDFWRSDHASNHFLARGIHYKVGDYPEAPIQDMEAEFGKIEVREPGKIYCSFCHKEVAHAEVTESRKPLISKVDVLVSMSPPV